MVKRAFCDGAVRRSAGYSPDARGKDSAFFVLGFSWKGGDMGEVMGGRETFGEEETRMDSRREGGRCVN